MSKIKRIVIFFIFMGLFSTSFQIGSMTQVNQEDAELLMEEFEELIEGIDGFGIFFHNITIALPMFIPGFGIAWGLFSGWSTGYAFASIILLTPELANIPPLALLFLSPFGLMELAAYSIATSRSYILIWRVIKKQSLQPAIRITVIEIGIMVGLLLVGGFLEDYMIKLAQSSGFEMPEI